MKTIPMKHSAPDRRHFLKSILVAGVAPLFVPSHVLGAAGQHSVVRAGPGSVRLCDPFFERALAGRICP